MKIASIFEERYWLYLWII